MPNLRISLCGCAFILALVVPAAAYAPKQGETCGATTSGNARTINGKAYNGSSEHKLMSAFGT
jgi:hypothetical protein